LIPKAQRGNSRASAAGRTHSSAVAMAAARSQSDRAVAIVRSRSLQGVIAVRLVANRLSLTELAASARGRTTAVAGDAAFITKHRRTPTKATLSGPGS
jgi:hypothetical protein